MTELISPQEAEKRRIIRALPSPLQMRDDVVETTLEALRKNFSNPIQGHRYRFELVGDLKVQDIPDPYDYDKIRSTMLKGGTIGAPVRGKFRVVDHKSGETIDEREVTVARIPTPVHDRTFVVNGKKRTILYQHRRLPGVFSRVDQRGGIVSEFNLDPSTSGRVSSFKVEFDRGSDESPPKYRILYGASKQINAWSVAKLLGATEEDLKNSVGEDVAKAITKDTKDTYERDLRQLHEKILKDKASSKSIPMSQIESDLQNQFNLTSMDAGVTKAMLGVSADRVTKDTLLKSFGKLRNIADGAPSDDRESLALKTIMTPADLIAESVGRASTVAKFQRSVYGRLASLNEKNVPNVDQLLGNSHRTNLMNRVSKSMVQRAVDSSTPLDVLANASATTLIGEGAISSDQAIPAEAKMLNSAGVGFLDPVHTPESARAGVVLHLPMRTRTSKVAKDPSRENAHSFSLLQSPYITLDGKELDMSPAQIKGKVVGMMDQYTMKDGKIVPKTNSQGLVKAAKDGEVILVKPSKVDTWMQDAGQVFDLNSSLVPFANSIQGGRVGYSAKQTQQSVALVNREEPLVQVKAPGSEYSLEKLIGEEAGAFHSPIDGKVLEIVEGGPGLRKLILEDKSGKKLEIKLPKNISMPGGTPMDSTPVVKVGDSVSRGDLLADSTFTKNGVMAMGVNLRTAYLPYHTSTFEDAITISQSAADKMLSEHMYVEEDEGRGLSLSKNKYKLSAQIPLTKKEEEDLDSNGVVKTGTILQPGQAYMVGSRQQLVGTSDIARAATSIAMNGSRNKRGISTSERFYEKRWVSPYPGEVVDSSPILKNGKVIGARVQIKTQEPMEVGDKVFGRHGNKGVVTEIVPDKEMLVNDAGEVVDIIVNTAGVTSRINPSQNFENWLGKVAKKNGKPEIVDAWTDEDNWSFTKRKLDEAGVVDAEDYLDPRTGKKLKEIGTGMEYFLKAKQQVEHKTASRGIGSFSQSGQAVKGEDGAQALGELGVYALLGQNAREFLRDAQIHKSEDRPEVWEALSRGLPLPEPKVPESFTRYQDYLKAAGVEIVHDQQKGKLKLAPPMTDTRIRELARSGNVDNLITDPSKTIKVQATGKGDKSNTFAVDKPEPGGLFDEKAVGGADGRRWARFELDMPIPNPLYEKPIKDLLGLKNKDYEDILAGVQGVKSDKGTMYGSQAINYMLGKLDTEAVYQEAYKIAEGADRDKDRSRAYRTLRTVKMLKDAGMNPQEAFMRKQVLVLPANIRGLRRDDKTGDFVIGDLNYLYRDIGLIDQSLRAARTQNMPPEVIAGIESGLYDSMRALLQTEGSGSLSGADYQGILGILSGRRPDSKTGKDISDVKQSYFKKNLMQRRQIMSARTVLTPDGEIGMDQVGIPRRVAVGIFEPLMEAEYKRINPNYNVGMQSERFKEFREAMKDYRDQNKANPIVDRVLDRVAQDRWVAVKRDPALHKFSVQGFQPVLTRQKTINLNPLVYQGFNADNDGDTLAIYAPVSQQASNELRDVMRPSANLFNLASHNVEHTLSHEAILGLSRMTKSPLGEKPKASFKDSDEAYRAFLKDEVEYDDLVTIDGKSTTLGQARIDKHLPVGLKIDDLRTSGVFGASFGDVGMSKKDVQKLVERIAIDKPNEFAKVVNDIRREASTASTLTSASMRLRDLKPILPELRKVVEAEIVKEIEAMPKNLSSRDEQDYLKDVYTRHLSRLDKEADILYKSQLRGKDANINVELTATAARIKPSQLKQVLLAPGALLDTSGKVGRAPVMRSYSEGMDMGSYLNTLPGSRAGTVSKVIQVQEPGYLTKQLVNTSIDQVITIRDCGTNRGQEVDLSNKDHDLANRILAKDVKIGSNRYSSGTTLNSQIISDIRRVPTDGPSIVQVRSPLYCKAKEGVCQVCTGKLPNGEFLSVGHNFGLTSAQALGERSTQMMLSLFHEGGVFDPSKKVGAGDIYQRSAALLRMPSTMGGNPAVVSSYNAKVRDVEPNKIKGGFDLKLDNGKTIYVRNGARAPDGKTSVREWYNKNPEIKSGQPLTDGLANPREILDKTGDIDQVRSYMTREIGGLFAPTGVLQRNVESMVRGLTQTVEVTKPGGTGLLPGERISLVQAEELAQKHPKFKYKSVLRGVDVAPRELREDFMAQMNYNSVRRAITDSAAIGSESDLHGTNPIPGFAYGREFNRQSRFGPPSKEGRY